VIFAMQRDGRCDVRPYLWTLVALSLLPPIVGEIRTRNMADTGIRPQGELTIYRALEHFEMLRNALDSGAAVVRVDLSGVSEIDSSGLQLLLLLRKQAQARGMKLAVVQASPVVRELLGYCNLGALLADTSAAAKQAA
jgi:anti-sigma B factor antagonist